MKHLKLILAGILVMGALAAVGLKSLFSVSTVGSPVSSSVRAGNDIVTLIRTLEGYVPSLHRNPENDRYRVGLLVTPLDAPSGARLIPLGRDFRSNDLQLAHVIGFDGTHVWCDVDQLQGVNLKTGKLVDSVKLRDANPSLDEYWDDPRRLSCETRLRVTTPDRKQFFEVDPQTLKAVPVQVQREVVMHSFGARLESFLKPQIKDGYPNAALVRSGPDAKPLQLSSPESFLMIYPASPALEATLVVARVTMEGEIIWKSDTGLERISLTQILPDQRFPAFVGTRPRVPGKVSEPMLVTLNIQSGLVSPHSLWR